MLAAHLEECSGCREKLAENRRLVEQLSATHTELDRSHAHSRARLLTELSNIAGSHLDSPDRHFLKLTRLTTRQRITAVGFASAAVAAIALITVAFNAGRSLSAMERMAKELKEVKSYSYQNTEHVVIAQKGKAEPGIVDLNQMFYWQAPGETREELKIVLSGAVPRGYSSGQVETDIVSISLNR